MTRCGDRLVPVDVFLKKCAQIVVSCPLKPFCDRAKYGEEVCAWIVLKPGQSGTEDEIKSFCEGRIAHFKVPQHVRFVEEFPMTITGKIVREITKNELGPLRVGRNITEFKWDGTDQYGQKLANGIYLYRVVTNLNGKSLEKYKAQGDDTDKYFNKGYGKMYLMR